MDVVAEHVDLMMASENFERTIANFDHNFSGKLIDLLRKIMDLSSESGHLKLLNILYRLDFNGFYKEKLEAMSAEKAMMESSIHSTDSGSTGSWPTSSFTSQRPETAQYVPSIHKQRPSSNSSN
ncbi:gamma-tubulin complex component 2-like [Saccostrea cucullata]|uniref:gamma-tubulin complex component 2-like n=1 Tax=Saccostrea cuccullata TaxID=36930 RepID=UPI002ED42604